MSNFNIIEKHMPERSINSRKGDNGIALVIGGSRIYHGAPILSSMAALRTGIDLV
jgi:NAD(P)H-hydrate epimerase